MKKKQRAKSVLYVDIKPRFSSGSPKQEIEGVKLSHINNSDFRAQSPDVRKTKYIFSIDKIQSGEFVTEPFLRLKKMVTIDTLPMSPSKVSK